MKANELRIGNHIINDGCVCEILHLYGGTYNYCRLKTLQGGDIVALYDLIKPIPLTHELLEKCGFSDKDYKSGYIGIEIKAGGMITDFVLTKPQVLGEFQKQFCWEYTAGNIPFFLKLEYLHQLQNLYFALTGEELEINLEEK